jgi:hypothetical protein
MLPRYAWLGVTPDTAGFGGNKIAAIDATADSGAGRGRWNRNRIGLDDGTQVSGGPQHFGGALPVCGEDKGLGGAEQGFCGDRFRRSSESATCCCRLFVAVAPGGYGASDGVGAGIWVGARGDSSAGSESEPHTEPVEWMSHGYSLPR